MSTSPIAISRPPRSKAAASSSSSGNRPPSKRNVGNVNDDRVRSTSLTHSSAASHPSTSSPFSGHTPNRYTNNIHNINYDNSNNSNGNRSNSNRARSSSMMTSSSVSSSGSYRSRSSSSSCASCGSSSSSSSLILSPIASAGGGAYLVHSPDDHAKIAVFKPDSEEADSGREGFEDGGPCSLREVAAYRLDFGGVAKVPVTTLTHEIDVGDGRAVLEEIAPSVEEAVGFPHVRVQGQHHHHHQHHQHHQHHHPHDDHKPGHVNENDDEIHDCGVVDGFLAGDHSVGGVFAFDDSEAQSQRHLQQSPPPQRERCGSLQAFEISTASAEDVGPLVLKRVSTRSVHAVGLLDARLANTDRHPGNLLIQGDWRDPNADLVAVPIDHGYVLPRVTALGGCNFDWISWPQADIPFDELTREQALGDMVAPPAEIFRILTAMGLSGEVAATGWLCAEFVRRAVSARWTLKRIGETMMRPRMSFFDMEKNEDENAGRSPLEIAVARAGETPAFDDPDFNVNGEMDAWVAAVMAGLSLEQHDGGEGEKKTLSSSMAKKKISEVAVKVVDVRATDGASSAAIVATPHADELALSWGTVPCGVGCIRDADIPLSPGVIADEENAEEEDEEGEERDGKGKEGKVEKEEVVEARELQLGKRKDCVRDNAILSSNHPHPLSSPMGHLSKHSPKVKRTTSTPSSITAVVEPADVVLGDEEGQKPGHKRSASTASKRRATCRGDERNSRKCDEFGDIRRRFARPPQFLTDENPFAGLKKKKKKKKKKPSSPEGTGAGGGHNGITVGQPSSDDVEATDEDAQNGSLPMSSGYKPAKAAPGNINSAGIRPAVLSV